jgi:hypothetical protein
MIFTTIFMYGRKTDLQDYEVAAVHMKLQTQQEPRLALLRDL